MIDVDIVVCLTSTLQISWKNMPMIAIMANLPLASSADSFLVFSSGSEEVKTLKP